MKGTRTLVNVRINADMAPTSRFIVYYVRPDAEIVADSIIFEVDGLFKNKVINKNLVTEVKRQLMSCVCCTVINMLLF